MGIIYLLRQGEYHKIGKTANRRTLVRRIATINTSAPQEVVLVHALEVKDESATEAALHHKFRAQRQNGEWFNLNAEQVAYIKKLDGTRLRLPRRFFRRRQRLPRWLHSLIWINKWTGAIDAGFLASVIFIYKNKALMMRLEALPSIHQIAIGVGAWLILFNIVRRQSKSF